LDAISDKTDRVSRNDFFTFSAADMHWPDLHNLMPNGEDSANTETIQEAARRRRKNLIDNPHIAA
jgi:hypothetical protein